MKSLTAREYAVLRDLERATAAGLTAFLGVPPVLEARGYVRDGDAMTCPFCGRKHPVGFEVTPLGKLAMRCYELLHTKAGP